MNKNHIILMLLFPMYIGGIAWYESHPLWVGHSSVEFPRTPGLQGSIDKALIARYLPPNPIIVEAGAHVGTDTYEMATSWPTSHVYCFEPVPHIFNQLTQKTVGLKNVFRYQQALADTTGTAIMYVSSGESDGSSSLLQPKEHLKDHPGVYFNNYVEVKTVRLDDWAEQAGIDHIDLLWLDMQGFEYAMLEASPKMLETVKVIYTEVSITEQYKNCPLYPVFKQWLEKQSFVVIREDLPWRNGGNVLFVRK